MKLGNLSAGSRDISLASRRYFNARQYADFHGVPFVGARKVLVEWQNPLVANISEEGKNNNLSIEGFQLSPQQSVCGCYSKDGSSILSKSV